MKKKTLIILCLSVIILSLSGCEKNNTRFGDGAEHEDLRAYIDDLSSWNLKESDFKNSSFKYRYSHYDSTEKISSISDEISIKYNLDDKKKIVSAELSFNADSKNAVLKIIQKLTTELNQNYTISSQKIRNFALSSDGYDFDKLDNDENLVDLINSKISDKQKKIEIESYYNPVDSNFKKISLEITLESGKNNNYENSYIFLKITNDPDDDCFDSENIYGAGKSTTYEEDSADEKDEISLKNESKKKKKKFIKSCKTYDYKKLKRYAGEYYSEKIAVRVKISQVLNNSDSTWYRAYQVVNGDMDIDKEFIIIDNRQDPDPKLLEDDIISVYGEYDGLEEITRSISDTTDEIPSISMQYMKLRSE